MKPLQDALIARARSGTSSEMRMNLIRESLHHLLLQEADRKGAFGQVCFLGGTALRILYGLDRFSEDLDFSLSQTCARPFSLETLGNSILKSLQAYGFECALEKLRTEKNVQGGFFSFKRLLHEVDRSFRREQKLAIKFEVDCRPPAGGVEVMSPVTGERIYKVRHYDLPSLFAGKLHAVLFRQYTKGRDLYDFLWYVGRHVKVNEPLLENATEQTQNIKLHLTTETLHAMLFKKFEETDFEKAKKDVAPFLEEAHALSLFQKEIFVNAANKVELVEERN